MIIIIIILVYLKVARKSRSPFNRLPIRKIKRKFKKENK